MISTEMTPKEGETMEAFKLRAFQTYKDQWSQHLQEMWVLKLYATETEQKNLKQAQKVFQRNINKNAEKYAEKKTNAYFNENGERVF